MKVMLPCTFYYRYSRVIFQGVIFYVMTANNVEAKRRIENKWERDVNRKNLKNHKKRRTYHG